VARLRATLRGELATYQRPQDFDRVGLACRRGFMPRCVRGATFEIVA